MTDPALESPVTDDPADRYRIAAVARLTGISETTIRMWERRYGVVEPARSTGNGRLYTRRDIERLQLLKQAVDAGHAIGTVAPLPDAQLRERLGLLTAPLRKTLSTPLTVLAQGPTLPTTLRQAWADRSDLQVLGIDADRAPKAQVVILEVPHLTTVTVAQARLLQQQSGARLAMVVFGFGSRAALQRLDAAGVIALASPADPGHLARLCHLALDRVPTVTTDRQWMQPSPRRRFDDAFLATTAQRLPSMACECPNHLADLLVKMNAFEAYSLACEQQYPDDAAMHGLLVSTAARCRALLEDALSQLLRHEGIEPPKD